MKNDRWSRIYGGVCLISGTERGQVKPNSEASSISAGTELMGANSRNNSKHSNGKFQRLSSGVDRRDHFNEIKLDEYLYP
jgi:hypothetical protein